MTIENFKTNSKVISRSYKDSNLNISLLGFGCMRFPLVDNSQEVDTEQVQQMFDYAISNGVNYFDTAWVYHDGKSEIITGNALKKYPRENFYLADKFPLWGLSSVEKAEDIFNEQLKKCQVEYFDFYLIHCLNSDLYAICKKYNIYELLKKKKAEGKIKHLGFSFHDDPDMLQQIVDDYEWDFAQIQLNYLDWDVCNAKRQYEILVKKNIPVIIMEPLRGGALATLNDSATTILKEANPEASIASWALRYAASLPDVLTVLSGMSSIEQVQDNVNTMTHFKSLTDEERNILEKALVEYRASGAIPCTGCKYCKDCPKNVNIPSIFATYNQYQISKVPYAFFNSYVALPESEQAHNCVDCKLCMEHCPQKLDIPNLLKEVDKLYHSLQ